MDTPLTFDSGLAGTGFVPSIESYLKILKEKYPTQFACVEEIINLTAILNLPKGTEQYISDIHGEYDSFKHVIRNCSGHISSVIRKIFPFYTLSKKEAGELSTLICYPRQKLPLCMSNIEDEEERKTWLNTTIYRLVLICRYFAAGYTRSKVRKTYHENFSYIIDELIYEIETNKAKHAYYTEIINSIVELGEAPQFILELCYLIHRLAVDKLHVIGDIFDRGPSAENVLEALIEHHNCDIQWGNHDVLWMGAAAGSEACICTVLRISLRYSNTATLEEGYGISLLSLSELATKYYNNDPCSIFIKSEPHASGPSKEESSLGGETCDSTTGRGTCNDGDKGNNRGASIGNSSTTPCIQAGSSKPATISTISVNHKDLIGRMEKAIAIMQFKLEGQIIRRRPEFDMDDRTLLDKIKFEPLDAHETRYSDGTETIAASPDRGVAQRAEVSREQQDQFHGAPAQMSPTQKRRRYRAVSITIEGKEYPLKDNNFPTIDPEDPFRLNDDELATLRSLKSSFVNSEKLQRHINFLYTNGSLYLISNRFLLLHGCVPLSSNGEIAPMAFVPQEAFLNQQRNHYRINMRLKEVIRQLGPDERLTSANIGTRTYFDIIENICRDAYFSGSMSNIVLTEDEAQILASYNHSGALEDGTGQGFFLSDINNNFTQNIIMNKISETMLTETIQAIKMGTSPRLTPYQMTVFKDNNHKLMGLDMLWYLWCGKQSPVYCRAKMATFERYFIDDKSTWVETGDPFYELRDKEEIIMTILKEFGGCEKIINGHLPVRVKAGEDPVKANKKLITIDGGFSKAYHNTTGIQGFSLICDHSALQLAYHLEFTSVANCIESNKDMINKLEIVDKYPVKWRIAETDTGERLQGRIRELSKLLQAYKSGFFSK